LDPSKSDSERGLALTIFFYRQTPKIEPDNMRTLISSQGLC